LASIVNYGISDSYSSFLSIIPNNMDDAERLASSLTTKRASGLSTTSPVLHDDTPLGPVVLAEFPIWPRSIVPRSFVGGAAARKTDAAVDAMANAVAPALTGGRFTPANG
jgi:hypothetical protein